MLSYLFSLVQRMGVSNKNINRPFLIVLLGLLAALSTLTVAMYIPGFSQMAEDFTTNKNKIAFTLTSYFIGITVGQLIYGPVIDKFGRRIPLIISLIVFVITSVGCTVANSLNTMVVLRFLQAIGASAGMVSALTVITDVFEPKERPRAFSLVMTVLGVAPVISPTLGSFFVASYHWESVFFALAVYGAVIVLTVFFFLPETALYKSSERLNIEKIVSSYRSVIKNKTFTLYAIAGSLTNSIIFAFVAASPVVFMEYYGTSPEHFALLYGVSAIGAMAGNYLNGVLVKKFNYRKMMVMGAVLLFLLTTTVTASVYLIKSFPLQAVVAALFFILLTIGLIYPNTVTAALSPFKELAGSASAMNGSFMMGMSALITAVIGMLTMLSPLIMFGVMTIVSILVLLFLAIAKRFG